MDHGYQIIYKGPEQSEEKQLVLIKNGEHFHAGNSTKGFLVVVIIVYGVKRNTTNWFFLITVALVTNFMLIIKITEKIRRKPMEQPMRSVDHVGGAFLVPRVSSTARY